METESKIRIGTRNSQLALRQTEMVLDMLKARFPQRQYEVISMTTTGDKILDSPLHQIGSKSLFTKELEYALLNDQVDIVVHSLKDLPTTLPATLKIGAILERENPRDVLIVGQRSVGKGWITLESMPDGAVIGTSSVRRIAQLKHNYPGLVFKDIVSDYMFCKDVIPYLKRGNLNTRLKKLDEEGSPFDGIILAFAGVHRLGWDSRISQILTCSHNDLSQDSDSKYPISSKPCLYAVGQGALAIECRENDHIIESVLVELNDLDTEMLATAERSLLLFLEGGCSVPIGVCAKWVSPTADEHGRTVAKRISLEAVVCSVDGQIIIRAESSAPIQTTEDAFQLGVSVAKLLLDRGAGPILSDIKSKRVPLIDQ